MMSNGLEDMVNVPMGGVDQTGAAVTIKAKVKWAEWFFANLNSRESSSATPTFSTKFDQFKRKVTYHN